MYYKIVPNTAPKEPFREEVFNNSHTAKEYLTRLRIDAGDRKGDLLHTKEGARVFWDLYVYKSLGAALAYGPGGAFVERLGV